MVLWEYRLHGMRETLNQQKHSDEFYMRKIKSR